MTQVYNMRLSTWMLAIVQTFARFLASVTSWECPQCGSRLSGQLADGTLSLVWENDSHAPSWSHFKHVAEVTSDGKCSIFCASVRSDAANFPLSGGGDGISFSTTNQSDETIRRRAREAQPCGCDLGAAWYCDEHCDNGDHRAPSQVVRDVLQES